MLMDEVVVCVLFFGVGGIMEFDVILVFVFNVFVIGFNVCVNK